jgi:hypothetical protein
MSDFGCKFLFVSLKDSRFRIKITENVKFLPQLSRTRLINPTISTAVQSKECPWHSDCLKIVRTHFPSFPVRREFLERGRMKAMRVLQKFLILVGMIAGLALAVSAQRNDDPKKHVPKGDPPVINPAPPKNPPPDGNKPRRPGYAAVVVFKSPDMIDLA